MLTGTKTMKARHYPHADHRGTTYKVTDENGDVVWTGLVDAFGKEVASSGTNPSIFWFQGQACFRKEIGGRVYYISPTRIYDAEDGRYLSRDPVGGPVGKYDYVGNNPPNFVDPTGLDKVSLKVQWYLCKCDDVITYSEVARFELYYESETK